MCGCLIVLSPIRHTIIERLTGFPIGMPDRSPQVRHIRRGRSKSYHRIFHPAHRTKKQMSRSSSIFRNFT